MPVNIALRKRQIHIMAQSVQSVVNNGSAGIQCWPHIDHIVEYISGVLVYISHVTYLVCCTVPVPHLWSCLEC